MTQRALFELLKGFAGQSAIFTTPKLFIHLTGEHVLALIFSQFIYWQDHEPLDDEGFFSKTDEEIAEALLVSPKILARARYKLAALGLESVRRGIPARMHYRIDEAKLISALNKFLPEGVTDPEGLKGGQAPEKDDNGQLLPEGTTRPDPRARQVYDPRAQHTYKKEDSKSSSRAAEAASEEPLAATPTDTLTDKKIRGALGPTLEDCKREDPRRAEAWSSLSEEAKALAFARAQDARKSDRALSFKTHLIRALDEAAQLGATGLKDLSGRPHDDGQAAAAAAAERAQARARATEASEQAFADLVDAGLDGLAAAPFSSAIYQAYLANDEREIADLRAKMRDAIRAAAA